MIAMMALVCYLVEADKGGDADVLLLQEGDASLRRVDGVHHDVVQGAAAGGNGHVVFLVDCAEVALRV